VYVNQSARRSLHSQKNFELCVLPNMGLLKKEDPHVHSEFD